MKYFKLKIPDDLAKEVLYFNAKHKDEPLDIHKVCQEAIRIEILKRG